MEFLIAAAGAVLIHILASEACAHVPGLAGRLISLAARRLPTEVRDRYREEWLAHMRELPGALTKLGFGMQCILASQALRAIPKECWAQSRQRVLTVDGRRMRLDPGAMLVILKILLHVEGHVPDATKDWMKMKAVLEAEINELTAEVGNAQPTQREVDQVKAVAEAFQRMANGLGLRKVQVEQKAPDADAGPGEPPVENDGPSGRH